MGNSKSCRLAGLIWLAMAATQAQAAGLGISPTSVEFAPQELAKGVTLRNTGSEPLQVQVRVYTWKQENNEDVLEATTDLVASPPFVSIAPGKNQLVRRGGSSLDGKESTYRMIVDELPVPASSSSPRDRESGLNFLMRFSVPIFLLPGETDRMPALDWQLEDAIDNHGRLVATNHGGNHARVTDLTLLDDTGNVVDQQAGLAGYVLPGSTREWIYSLPSSGMNATTVRMQLNGQPATLVLGAPAGN